MLLRLIVLVAVLTISTRAQLIQEDFNGTALSPVWVAIPLSGSIAVSGGAVHLATPAAPAGVLYSFPYLGVAPGVVTVPTPVWVVETRIAWSVNPSLGYPFGVSHPYLSGTSGCIPSGSMPSYCAAYANPGPTGAPGYLHTKAGATLALLPAIDNSFHTYRWVCDGVTVSLSIDSVLSLTGPYDGKQPNNIFMGNPCFSGVWGGSTMDVDYIRIEWGQVLDAPAASSIGTAVNYHLAMPGLSPYLVDVSTTGTSPGFFHPPSNLWIPLNPPFLNHDYGAAFPGVFVGFTGSAGSNGIASASVNLPTDSGLVGLALSATFVVLDPMAPGGVAAVAQPRTTLIVP